MLNFLEWYCQKATVPVSVLVSGYRRFLVKFLLESKNVRMHYDKELIFKCIKVLRGQDLPSLEADPDHPCFRPRPETTVLDPADDKRAGTEVRAREKTTLHELESTYLELCDVFRDIEDFSQAEPTASSDDHDSGSGEEHDDTDFGSGEEQDDHDSGSGEKDVQEPSVPRQSTRFFQQMVHFHCHKSFLFKTFLDRERRQVVDDGQEIHAEVGRKM